MTGSVAGLPSCATTTLALPSETVNFEAGVDADFPEEQPFASSTAAHSMDATKHSFLKVRRMSGSHQNS